MGEIHPWKGHDQNPQAPDDGGYRGINRILVCLDGSRFAETGLDYALAIARACRAELQLFHVVEEVSHPHHRVPIDTLGLEISKTKAMQYLEEIQRRVAGAEVPVTTSICSGNAPEHILRMIQTEKIDLVVLSSNGRHGTSTGPLGRTTFLIVQQARTSLLLVPAIHSDKRTKPVRLRRILVLLDASTRAECTLPLAHDLALVHGSEVLVAHVVPRFQMAASQPLCHRDQELLRQVQDRNLYLAQSYIRGIGARLSDSGVEDVRTIVLQARDFRQEIVNLAEREGVDLILLSAHGQTANPALPHGSISQHLLTFGTTPVLVLQDISELE